MISAYIDLNPVRAGMVKDPKDYRWCGYGQAVAGVNRARVGLCELMKRVSRVQPGVVLDSDLRSYGWRTIAGCYRMMLFDQGRQVTQHEATTQADTPKVTKRGYTTKEVEAEEERAGELSLAESLRVKIRYFSEGAMIGSQSYVEEALCKYRDKFTSRRLSNNKQEARRIRNLDGLGLGGVHLRLCSICQVLE